MLGENIRLINAMDKYDLWDFIGPIESKSSTFYPQIDVASDDKNYFVIAEVPGMLKESIKIDLEDNTLTLSGTKTNESADENTTYLSVERSVGKFVRSFKLPEDVDTEKITATMDLGILTVTLPKDEKLNKNKKIDIT